jgi:tRNA pseudouridine38-40 synthase
MVKGLTATMLKVGRNKMNIDLFRRIVEGKDCTLANFSAPAHGLFLAEVTFPDGYFN